MESNIELKKFVMKTKVEEFEGEQGEKIVNFVIEDLDNSKIALSTSNVDDIKRTFDNIFEYIISEEKVIELELDCAKDNLFHEVAKDLVEHLNKEIEQSKENFEKLIAMQSTAK